jgi:hypothetical protein
MNVRPLLIANAQPTELIQPSERPFHHPSPSTQPAAVVGVAPRKKRDDASVTQTMADRFGIVTPVAEQAVRTTARPAPLSL